jgi:hypothetical protein
VPECGEILSLVFIARKYIAINEKKTEKNGKTRCGATPERVCNAIQSTAPGAMKN